MAKYSIWDLNGPRMGNWPWACPDTAHMGPICACLLGGYAPGLVERGDHHSILKPYKEAHEAASYRPISLISALCKIMETMITNRLKLHIEQNDKLVPTQSGFRNNRSTQDQLTILETVIKSAFANKKYVVSVFLDLEKAFDLMWTKGAIKTAQNQGGQE